MKSTGAASIVAGAALQAPLLGKEKSQGNPENIVKRLYDTLDESQKKVIAFDWYYKDPAEAYFALGLPITGILPSQR